ncbi:MAG TPA: imidazole glycerol phosphate synthase subunit HisH [Kiloniellales bacterium]
MKLAVVDYGSGNLHSAAKALERAASDAGVRASVAVTPAPDAVRRADRIVLPGEGAFGDCRRGLAALDGMIEVLEERVIAAGRPFLGICVGMQLMATTGREHGRHPGLGWIAGEVVAIDREDQGLKVPHMGWNELNITGARHPVFQNLPSGTDVYFAHSYTFRAEDRGTVWAEVDYGGPVTAAVGRDNMIGTQFHPEKSQRAGLRLLANFLNWNP